MNARPMVLRLRAIRHACLRETRPGQAIIEMALIVTFLLSLTFGVADLGIYMYDYIQASNCARDVARRAVVRDANAASAPSCGPNGLTPQLTGGYMTLAAGSEVQVSVTQNHQWIVLCYFVPSMPCNSPVTATTSMRMEGAKL